MIGKQSLPSAPMLIESMRSLGYSFETAIADLIDNSISALATKIEIFLLPSENPNVIVFDNGNGMSKEELEKALRYGAKNPLEKRSEMDLGRFGLGMKSASLSQCRKLTVASKKDGEISAFSWDLDFVIEQDDWLLQEYSAAEIQELPNIELFNSTETGTYILLQNFDKIQTSTANLISTLNGYMDNTIEHLSLVFHRFIDEGLQIYVNNNKIIARDPFLVNNKGTTVMREQSINIDGEVIKVKPYVLPHISKLTNEDMKKVGGKEDLKTNQGFYIYRNKRLIIWGTWFRLTTKEELSKLARVMVDIPSSLDYMWNIDIKKSSAYLPDRIKRNLFSCIEESIFKSKNVYEYRGRKVNSNTDINYVWERIELREGCYEYRINRNIPQLKLLEELLDSNQLKALGQVINNIEECFPINSLYLDASKGKMANQNEQDRDKEIIENLYKELIENLNYCESKGMDKEEMKEVFLKTEPYCNYKELKERLKEYDNE